MTRIKPKHPLFYSWRAMLRRCSDVKSKDYPHYGGRGIKVAARWKSFSAFCKDMGPKPDPADSLERSNTNGDYKPDNVKWASRLEQANNRRVSKRITHNGITLTAAQWGRLMKIPRQQIANRINRGWSTARALTTPCYTKGFEPVAIAA